MTKDATPLVEEKVKDKPKVTYIVCSLCGGSQGTLVNIGKDLETGKSIYKHQKKCPNASLKDVWGSRKALEGAAIRES